MKASNQSKQAKCHPIQWLLPLPLYGYVPVMIGRFLFLDDEPLAGLYLYADSASLLMKLIPVYVLAIVWLTIRRVRQGNNTPELTVFQIAALILPTIWLCLGSMINGVV